MTTDPTPRRGVSGMHASVGLVVLVLASVVILAIKQWDVFAALPWILLVFFLGAGTLWGVSRGAKR